MLITFLAALPLAATMAQVEPEHRSDQRSEHLIQGFEPPFRVTAEGAPIVPGSGHAKPLVVDWDGDGVRDLLVGQFGGGRLRIHLNRSGQDGAWKLDGGRWFYADGRLGTVPFG